VHLVAIGGWLPRIGETGAGLMALRNFDSVSAQLKSITDEVSTPKAKYWFPNFRQFDPSTLPPRKPSNTIRLVHVSRLFREKGIFESIATAKLLDAKGYTTTLVICGPDEFESENDRDEFFSELEAGERLLSYLGDLPNQQVIPLIASHDFLLFPSSFADEGFPGVVVEAAIAGTPVIAKKTKQLAEILATDLFGVLVEGHFPEEACEVIAGSHLDNSLAPRPPSRDYGLAVADKWFEDVTNCPSTEN